MATVVIDKNKCIGCGACASICSEGFVLKGGKSNVKNPNAPCVDEAISACPVGAITKKK
ncbi:MAG: ferredoxin [Candidatus Woesearchaeota archaeon]|nr:ferredoxin [Candidatus Woesearchaeota archaeon]